MNLLASSNCTVLLDLPHSHRYVALISSLSLRFRHEFRFFLFPSIITPCTTVSVSRRLAEAGRTDTSVEIMRYFKSARVRLGARLGKQDDTVIFSMISRARLSIGSRTRGFLSMSARGVSR